MSLVSAASHNEVHWVNQSLTRQAESLDPGIMQRDTDELACLVTGQNEEVYPVGDAAGGGGGGGAQRLK